VKASRALLTVDLGNARTKLCAWEPGAERASATEVLPSAPGLGAAAAAWVLGLPEALRGAPCAVSAVADAALETELVSALEAAGSAPAQVAGAGLTNLCREPWTVGADRLFAARGALELTGSAALVVDAGTALTVDAARLEDGPRGAFLGGAIAPGPALLARALAEGGARLPADFSPRPGVPALGRETREALEAGVVVGFRGAARELCARVAEEAELEGAPVVIAGGAALFLLEPEPFLGGDLRHEPELVHLGLLAAAGDPAR
jgi:type III pantothenate kinase